MEVTTELTLKLWFLIPWFIGTVFCLAVAIWTTLMTVRVILDKTVTDVVFIREFTAFVRQRIKQKGGEL